MDGVMICIFVIFCQDVHFLSWRKLQFKKVAFQAGGTASRSHQDVAPTCWYQILPNCDLDSNIPHKLSCSDFRPCIQSKVFIYCYIMLHRTGASGVLGSFHTILYILANSHRTLPSTQTSNWVLAWLKPTSITLEVFSTFQLGDWPRCRKIPRQHVTLADDMCCRWFFGGNEAPAGDIFALGRSRVKDDAKPVITRFGQLSSHHAQQHPELGDWHAGDAYEEKHGKT